MENAPCWIVDAFVGSLGTRDLRGNPAAVVLLDSYPDDAVMQERANEFNLSETAFVVSRGDCQFDLRWMTPQVEVDLCGHATLAAAYALVDANKLVVGQTARFHTRNSTLKASVQGDGSIELDFPVQNVEQCAMPDELARAFGWEEEKNHAHLHKLFPCFRAKDDFLVCVHETVLEHARPDFGLLARLDARGVIVTAQPEWPGFAEGIDFYSRFFAPRIGINEDSVSGSTHTKLAPFWAVRLDKTKLKAVQLSDRGGQLELELRGERVAIAGQCALRARGKLC